MTPHRALADACPHMARLIDHHGELELGTETIDFHALAVNILWQQLSGKAARSIYNKLCAGLDTDPDADRLLPQQFVDHTPETLRPFGVSRQKAGYLLDLAARSHAGQIHYGKFESMSNEEIIADLTQVRGIGVWTVQMLLMFSLARPDVFPTGDLGVQNGLMRLFELDAKPKPKELSGMGDRWRPYRSYASLYLWKLVDG